MDNIKCNISTGKFDFLYNFDDSCFGFFTYVYGVIPNLLAKEIYTSPDSIDDFEKGCAAIEKVLEERGIDCYTKTDFQAIPQKRKTKSFLKDNSIIAADFEDNNSLSIDDADLENEDEIHNRLYIIDNAQMNLLIGCVNGKKFSAFYGNTKQSKELVNELYKAFSSLEHELEYNNHVFLLTRSYGDLTYQSLSVKEQKGFDVRKLYSDDFYPISEKIESFIDSNESGLVILHGKQGSGKTSYIRHLINKHNKKFVFLPLELVPELSSPSFISFMKKYAKDVVMIVEDCEVLLRERSKSGVSSSGIVNILNISDGLLSDCLNIKFICTFNSKYEDVDKALLRKGRLIERYDFKELPLEKTNNLLKELYGTDFGNNKELTLSDIFNYKNDNHGIVDNAKIGF